MKKLALVMLLSLASSGYSASFETSGGIGAVVPDSENVESSVIGKVDVQSNINKYVSFGISASQTEDFKQENKPSEVKYAETNPKAFAGTTFHPVQGDTLVINNNTTNITNITVSNAPDKLPQRPQDLTERSFWAAESFVQLGIPIYHVRPYVRASFGAAGVRVVNGETLIGSSRGLGGGISVYTSGIILSVEAMRRYIDAGRQTFGNWSYVARAGIQF